MTVGRAMPGEPQLFLMLNPEPFALAATAQRAVPAFSHPWQGTWAGSLQSGAGQDMVGVDAGPPRPRTATAHGAPPMLHAPASTWQVGYASTTTRLGLASEAGGVVRIGARRCWLCVAACCATRDRILHSRAIAPAG